MSTISTDERREVARRLRHAWVNVPDRDPVRHHLRVLCAIYEAVGVSDGESDAIDLFDRLADLIEPSGHECVPGKCPLNVRHDNDSIDRDALLALASGLEADADRILRAARNARFGGGPRVGEAKHDAYEWRSIARRIRKACGEVAE